MAKYTFSMFLMASLNFYCFEIFDIAMVIVLSVIVLMYYFYYLCTDRNTEQSNKYIPTMSFLISISLGALLGYCNGFRYYLANNIVLEENIGAFENLLQSIIPFWDIQFIAQYWYQQLQLYTSKDTAALILALSIGNKDYLHLAFLDLVRRNGISHLLALSGFHLSIVIISLEYLAKGMQSLMKRNIDIRIMNKLFLIMVWSYCIFIGFIPSLYRAACMYTISIFLKENFGKSSFLATWSGTGLLLQLFAPHIMYSHGFILSMCALLGVHLGVYYGNYVCKFLPTALATPITIGLGASLMTTWYSYLFFGASYPIGILMSLFLTPIVTIFMVMGILLLICSYLSLIIPLGQYPTQWLGYLLDKLLSFIQLLIANTANLVEINSGGQLVLYYVLMCSSIVIYMKLFHKRKLSEY